MPRVFHAAPQTGNCYAAVTFASRGSIPLVQSVTSLAASMATGATDAFPAADIDALRDLGALAAVLPRHHGGLGIGTEPGGTAAALELLVALGRGNLATARLFEAHLNAIRLAVLYADAAALQIVADDVQSGHLFGLWVTNPAHETVREQAGALAGSKGPCSGAGHCRRALVTVGERMAIVALDGTEAVRPVIGLQGMRGAANGIVALETATLRCWIGAAGDYLREPDFSGGAWRGSAAASGALEALVDAVAAELRRRRQQDAPMQLARFGAMLIARDTARMWADRAATAAEQPGDPAQRVATVNLARIAVESACLDAIRDAQRSIGLAAFIAPHPVERIARDLATYLRQPAPDAVLLEAAAWHLR